MPTLVREELLGALNQGAATLLIADLSKTSFCDSAGVSVTGPRVQASSHQ